MANAGKQRRLPRHAILRDENGLERSARTTELGAYNLLPTELFWQVRYSHLAEHGYVLRPRYEPGWEPSWIGTNLDPEFCEDSIMSVIVQVMDARRRRDNFLVAVKSLPKDTDEIRIAQFLTSIRDHRNHCAPVLDILDDPFDPEFSLLVMPLLRQCNDPPLTNVGELVDLMDQTFEGLAFLHEHRIAHRDIAVQNIMMDARPLFPEGYHPVRQNYTPDGMYTISPLSRTDRPVRYYYIDFGLSVQFAPGAAPYVVGDVGRDTDVPELSDSVPYDPFKVDIFALGNLFYKEFYQKYTGLDCMSDLLERMRQHEPAARPTIDQALALWKDIKATLPSSSHRARLAPRSEPAIERVLNDTVAAAWNGLYSLKRLVY